MTRRLAAVLVALGLVGPCACAQEAWPDPGPSATRDLFPLNLLPLTYRPASAVPLRAGETRVAMQVIRANTFEFSDLIKDHLAHETGGRTPVTPAMVAALAAQTSSEPLLYYFDGEVQRTDIHIGRGVGRDLEVGLTLGWQSLDGGFLDGLIEGVHRLGFEQTGRGAIARNQLTLVVLQRGEVITFRQKPIRFQATDPVLSFVWRACARDGWSLSATGALQVPLVSFEGHIRTTWDFSTGLLVQSPVRDGWSLNGGVAYLRRGTQGGFRAANPFLVKDQAAGHVGIQYEGWRRVRPYLVLLYHDGLLVGRTSAALDQPALNHDLGVHIRIARNAALTLGYINNITHNENTADMAFEVRVSAKF